MEKNFNLSARPTPRIWVRSCLSVNFFTVQRLKKGAGLKFLNVVAMRFVKIINATGLKAADALNTGIVADRRRGDDGQSYRMQLKHHPQLSAPTLANPIGKGDNSSWTTFH